MYTQCPHCQTAFQVSSAQLKAAQGMVRCGNCHRIFNSLPRLVEAMPDSTPKLIEGGPQVSAGDIPVVESEEIFEEIEITDPIPTTTPSKHSIPTAQNEVDVPEPRKHEEPVPKETVLRKTNLPPGQPETNHPPRQPEANKPVAPPPTPATSAITAALRQKNDPQKLEASRKALHERLAKTKSKLLAKRHSSPADHDDQDSLFDGIIAGNELINASADVAPADLRFDAFDDEYDVSKYAKSPPKHTAMPTEQNEKQGIRWNTVAWISGIAALVMMGIIQYAFYIKEDLVKVASMRPFFQTICSVVTCDPLLFDSSKLKIIANLDYHPDNPGALKINVKVENTADLTQYYPVLELVLRNGKKRHVELFYPVQYLPARSLERKGIPPHKHFQATLNIVNPFHGQETLSYQVNALRNDL